LIELLAEIGDQAPAAMVETIRGALERVDAIGLGYLSLDQNGPISCSKPAPTSRQPSKKPESIPFPRPGS
jgi:hypothetical protein